jgi:hypothetical protein
VNTYVEKQISSIAFLLLGTQNGGIEQNQSLEIMNKYLSKCELPIEIGGYVEKCYHYLFYVKSCNNFQHLSIKS